MSDFIREVDEEVRHDQFRRFLQRYWIALIVLVILVLAGVGAWQAYDYLRTQKAQASGGQYLDALDLARDGKTDEAAAALRAVAADGTAGYRLLARFRLAGETGVKDAAAGAKLFDDLATDPAVDPALQNVARLRAGLLLLDSASYPDIRRRLEPLADANNPVRNAAREMLALAALKADLPEDAGRDLDAIAADPTTSNQLRQRVGALQGLVRGAPKSGAPPAAPAPAPAASVPPAVAPETPPASTPAPATMAPAPDAGTPPSPAAPAEAPAR